MSKTTAGEANQRISEDMLAVAKHRDHKAFTRLFDHFVPLVKAFSIAACPGATLLANEVAQEVMIKVWTKADTYNPKVAAVSTWVFTLARNARIDYLRKNSRHMSDIDPAFIYQDLADEFNDPFLLAQQKCSEDFVKKVMAELPPDQHEVLEKVYLEGKTHEHVAKELDLPLGTVKSRLRLAFKKLAIRG
ncbi:MAG: sigma-70 family RNA polymerase sigma factor [Exilibacterium sp.]